MIIIPILKRELLVATRQPAIHIERCALPAILLVCILSNFVPETFHEASTSSEAIARAAERSLLAAVAWHFVFLLTAVSRSAAAIASEKDRHTLDFLLGTQLSNSEIILGKYATCLVLMFSTFCAGLPPMLVLEQLGAAEWPLFFLIYAGILSTALLVCAMALCASVESLSTPKATGAALMLIFAWMIAPSPFLSLMRAAGITLPDWLIGPVALLASSSPLSVLKAFAPGGATWSALAYHVGWMIAMQTIGTCAFLAVAIKRLRSAYRTKLDGADECRRHAVWRFRPRPPVGDDPILWRAMYTSRGTGFDKVFQLAFNVGLLASFAYATWQYAAPALLEVRNHGYGTTQRTEPPDLNFFAIFYTNPSSLVPADFARTQFNVFIRFVSILLVIVVTSGVGSYMEADLSNERARETWLGLLATSLTGADILRAKALTALWRMKGVATVTVILWGVGVLAGAIHPLGFLYALLAVTAWSTFFMALGAQTALRSETMKPGSNPASVLFMALPVSALILMFLPARFRSVLLGAASSVFVVWMSLFSYRDIRDVALFSAPLKAYDPLKWIGLATGDSPWLVIITCLAGVIIPAAAGLAIWQRTVANFDTYVGRPVRSHPTGPGTTGRLP